MAMVMPKLSASRPAWSMNGSRSRRVSQTASGPMTDPKGTTAAERLDCRRPILCFCADKPAGQSVAVLELAALRALGPRLVHVVGYSACRSPRESGPDGHAVPGPPPGTGAVAVQGEASTTSSADNALGGLTCSPAGQDGNLLA